MTKIHRMNYSLIKYAYVPAITLSILIVHFFPQVIFNIPSIGGLTLIIIILGIILSPIGSLRFGINKKSPTPAMTQSNENLDVVGINLRSLFKKFITIVFIEAIAMIVDRGTQIAAYAIRHVAVPFPKMILLSDIQPYWHHFILYPWVLYALFGAALAWARARSDEDVIEYSNGLKPLLKKYLTSNVITSVVFLLRTSFIVIFTTTISILLAYCIDIIAQKFALTLSLGYTLKNCLIGIFVLQMIFSKKALSVIRYLSYSNKSLGSSLIVLIIFLFLQMSLLSALLSFAAAHLRHPHFVITLPQWLVKLSSSDFIFLAFQSTWQLAAAAGFGICLARIAKGLSLRAYFFLVLVTPLLIQLSSLIPAHLTQEITIIFPSEFSRLGWLNIADNNYLPGLALIILCICLLRLNGTSELFRLSLSTFPLEAIRMPTNIVRGLFYNITLLTLMIWTGVIDLLLLANTIMVVPMIFVAMMIITAFVKDIIVK